MPTATRSSTCSTSIRTSPSRSPPRQTPVRAAAYGKKTADNCHSGIVKLFATVTASPEKAGTFAARKIFATHPPTDVPPNGPSITFALVARPVGENVTWTLPLPVGPSSVLHDEADADAASSAVLAAL